jgi:hypothetical protein
MHRQIAFFLSFVYFKEKKADRKFKTNTDTDIGI